MPEITYEGKVKEVINDLPGIAHRMITKKGTIFPKDELRKHWEDLTIELKKELEMD